MGCASSVNLPVEPSIGGNDENLVIDESNSNKKYSLKEKAVDEKITKVTEIKNGDNYRHTIKSAGSAGSLNSDPQFHRKIQYPTYVDEDGLSNLSLTSKITLNQHVTERKNDVQENGLLEDNIQPIEPTQSQIILERALKELRQSLYESKPSHYTPETANNTETGIGTDHYRVQTGTAAGALTGEYYNKYAVLDVGSGFCKAGLSGDDTPSVVMPTVVGRSRDGSFDELIFGNVAKLRKDELNFTNPVQRGVCVDWEEMEKVYDYVINMKLSLEISEHGIAMVDTVSTKSSREKLTEILFEKMNAGNFYLGSCGSLSCHALAQTTGLVVSMGHEVTSCIPVINGNVIFDSTRSTNIGGSDVTNHLLRSMIKNKVQGINSEDIDIARAMMEKHCFVSKNNNKEEPIDLKRNYTLPSGKIAQINQERSQSTEVLFKPQLINENTEKSIQSICCQSYRSLIESSQQLIKNVILVGGMSLLPGIVDRLGNELKALETNFSNINILTLPRRQYAAWRGASFISTLGSTKRRWISKSSYEEHGASIIHRKYV